MATSLQGTQSFSSDERSHPETAKNRTVIPTKIRSISPPRSMLDPVPFHRLAITAYLSPHKDGINSGPTLSCLTGKKRRLS